MNYSPEFYRDRWQKANLPVKYWDARIEDYEHPNASGGIAKMEAAAFVKEFPQRYVSERRKENGDIPDKRHLIGKGMLLYGRNGTRKSTLAAAILTDVQYKAPAYRGYYIRFSEWKRHLTNTFSKDPNDLQAAQSAKVLLIVERIPLLVLDDIGQEHRTQSGFTESMLHELLRVRYEAARPTVATTNIEPSAMLETYGPSFDSFRYDAFDTIRMLGRDSRKPAKED